VLRGVYNIIEGKRVAAVAAPAVVLRGVSYPGQC
jgi:hypothetical protein